MTVAEPAPAKINLYLHVTGRRADGYHLLDSLAVFAGARDMVRAQMADSLSLSVEGPFAAGLTAEADNLVLRAARALAAAAGVPALGQLELAKHLPVASGIGGGSADAAATLRALSKLWGLSMPSGMLTGLAAGLGADVPVCLLSRSARMGGIGERLTASPALPLFGLVLVNPGEAVSTATVFRALDGRYSPPALLPAGWNSAQDLAQSLAALGNDLEAPARAICPAIDAALAALCNAPGCLLARMSGSGATCFGLFASPSEADLVAADMARPGRWCWGGGLWDFTG